MPKGMSKSVFRQVVNRKTTTLLFYAYQGAQFVKFPSGLLFANFQMLLSLLKPETQVLSMHVVVCTY